jgi:hypothetical protein
MSQTGCFAAARYKFKAIIGNPKPVLKFKCIFNLMNKYALN